MGAPGCLATSPGDTTGQQYLGRLGLPVRHLGLGTISAGELTGDYRDPPRAGGLGVQPGRLLAARASMPDKRMRAISRAGRRRHRVAVGLVGC